MHSFRDFLVMNSSAGILTIDLGAIQSNWRYVASRLKHTECAAVVKANAYGVGDVEVASALYQAGCKSFYLATMEEAAALRLALPKDATLFVLGGVRAGAEPEFLQLNLIPVLFTLNNIYSWLKYCASLQRSLPCVIKLDTGMSRLGLGNAELNEFVASVPSWPWFNPILLMSHLACADEPDHPLNDLQLNEFQAAIKKIKVFFPAIKTSLANSSGTFLGENYHFDMVRIGAALYGINPQPSLPNPLAQVIELKLPVLQIRTAEKPVFVGYSAEGQANAEMRLAVVAGGYADGIHRTLGVRPKGLANGAPVSTIGRISMDSTVFDISAIASSPEYIQVINNELRLDVIMKDNKSLGYEVLTSLGRRYLRRYLHGSG
jgi:alanine racemase